MATTTLKTRIQHKYDTPAKWAEDTSFVPLKGEICVFNNGTGVKPEMKIGDGITTLASLPFLKAGGDVTVSRSLTSGTKIATITIDGVATDLYCQTNTDTTYSAGAGLNLSGTTFSTNNNRVFMFYDRNDIGTSPNYDDPGVNGHFELRSSSEVTGETGIKPFDGFGSFISIKNSNTMFQLAGNSHKGFYIRATQSSNVTLSGISWQEILTDSNYTSYVPTKTGSGASGTWGINISGNAYSVRDAGDGRTLTFNYSADGMASATWIAAWNGNCLQGIHKNNLTVGNATTAAKANQLGEYETAGEYSKHTLAYFNACVANTGTAQAGVNDSPSTEATWWHFLRFTHSNSAGYYTDLAIPFNTNSLYYKRIGSGSVANSTTNAGWVKILDQLNYTDYTVTKTGSGASGTWGINITGNAATATALSSEISNSRLPIRLRENTSGTAASPNTFMSSGFYYTGNSGISNVSDANILTIAHTKNGWCHQLGFKFNGGGVSGASYDGADIYTRIYNNTNNAWSNWHVLLSSGNYTAYCAPVGHTHNYLPLSGGAMTGRITQIYGTPAASIGNMYISAAIQIRENNAVGASQSDILYAPTLGFHWSGRVACNLSLHSDGALYLYNNGGNLSAFKAGSVYGAVWNDYAEFRESTTTKPGLVVFENGDDTLSPTTERLSHFAGVVSDTWGFCQGETERAKTSIAVAGRVLAYPFRDRNEYKPGDCVCAAPNGTIDIMTREEVERYPDRIVGTVSCVPEYEEWGSGDRPAVRVDGRIWVKVR